MQTHVHVVECEAAPTASSTLITLRAQLTALTFPSPYLTEAEKLLANHHIHECEDRQRLRIWLQNVPLELAQREAACYGLSGPCSVRSGQLYLLNTPSQAAARHPQYGPCSAQAGKHPALNTPLSSTLS